MAKHTFEVIVKVIIPQKGSGLKEGQRRLVRITLDGPIPHVLTLRDGSIARVEKVK